MGAKLILVLVVLVVFILGGIGGVFVGISAASASITGQLYAGGMEMTAVLSSLKKGEIETAEATLCNSIHTRLTIMSASLPLLSQRQLAEVDAFKFAATGEGAEKLHQQADVLCAQVSE